MNEKDIEISKGQLRYEAESVPGSKNADLKNEDVFVVFLKGLVEKEWVLQASGAQTAYLTRGGYRKYLRRLDKIEGRNEEAEEAIDAAEARRKANIVLSRRIGERLCATDSGITAVYSDTETLRDGNWTDTFWLVPVWITTLERGPIKRIGILKVDAWTGIVEAGREDLEQLRVAARAALQGSDA